MEWNQLVAILMLVLAVLVKYIEWKHGANREAPLAFLNHMRDLIYSVPLPEFGRTYKEKIKELSSAAFVRMKMRGVLRVKKDPHIVSRGFHKLDWIIGNTRILPKGRVLSLACGRGGWEQRIAPLPSVDTITSVTFGSSAATPGHEDFVQDHYPGWKKIAVINKDIREFDLTPHDFLLFDGGESKPGAEMETKAFNNLLYHGVCRQINEHTKGFIIKILTPWDERTMELMEMIQSKTKMGDLVRVPMARNSTLEVYLVSNPERSKLRLRCQALLQGVFDRAVMNPQIDYYKLLKEAGKYREEIEYNKIEILPRPNYVECIAELSLMGRKEYGNDYKQWDSLGVYDIGVKGNKSTNKNLYTSYIVGDMADDLESYSDWSLTDTTPEGFMKVFKAKIDTCPIENHDYPDQQVLIYQTMAKYFKKRGFVLKELTWEELEEQANKNGAAGYADKDVTNIREFLSLGDWRKRIEECRSSLLQGKPIHAIFNTMGKREKKKMAHGKVKGSRMVAYQSIAMRLLEMKLFGNLLKLTKPKIAGTNTTMNRFGVGGMGLHDYGMRIEEIWLGRGTADDVAGFDTRIGLFDQSCEYEFCKVLGASESHRAMYRVYGHPLILIPIPSPPGTVRSELLIGRGQRMSGTAITYSMNTITRIAKFFLTLAIERKLSEGEIPKFVMDMMEDSDGKKTNIAGVVSGDDAMFTSTDHIMELQKAGVHLDCIGMQRKDMRRGQTTEILETIEEVDFCSHHYEKVTYYDSDTGAIKHRYMPTRDASEILAKATFKVGMYGMYQGEKAWAAAQAANLLVNYHHMRTIRAAGIAMRCLIDPNLIPNDKGGFIRPTPWMQRGDILEIVNRVLFGESTHYPQSDFKVRSFGHLGYMSKTRELAYDNNCFGYKRKLWRQRLCNRTIEGIARMRTGGCSDWIEEWHTSRSYRPDNEGYYRKRS